MAKLHAYLNFNGNCKEAFEFYQKVFKTESLGTYTFDQIPPDPNAPPLPASVHDKVMHTAIKINENSMLMGSDIVEEFGQKPATFGNSTYIMLDVETAKEAKEFFQALAEDAKLIEMDLAETFYAELFGCLQDKFGIQWMIHFEGNKKMNE